MGQILEADWAIDGLIGDAAARDPREAMRTLAVPTTLVHGVLDPEVPLAVSREAAALLPHARVEPIEGCAHMPHLEDRLGFSARLQSILEADAR